MTALFLISLGRLKKVKTVVFVYHECTLTKCFLCLFVCLFFQIFIVGILWMMRCSCHKNYISSLIHSRFFFAATGYFADVSCFCCHIPRIITSFIKGISLLIWPPISTALLFHKCHFSMFCYFYDCWLFTGTSRCALPLRWSARQMMFITPTWTLQDVLWWCCASPVCWSSTSKTLRSVFAIWVCAAFPSWRKSRYTSKEGSFQSLLCAIP